jgi:hypothetical protein
MRFLALVALLVGEAAMVIHLPREGKIGGRRGIMSGSRSDQPVPRR